MLPSKVQKRNLYIRESFALDILRERVSTLLHTPGRGEDDHLQFLLTEQPDRLVSLLLPQLIQSRLIMKQRVSL